MNLARAANRTAAVVHTAATRLRWPLILLAGAAWWTIAPPTTVGGLVISVALLIMGHRLLAPAAVLARRRSTLRARLSMAAVIGILGSPAVTPTPAIAAPVDPDMDYCRSAPTPETVGAGVTGILDPQKNLPMDGTPYGDRGFAGMFWHAYDPGCVAAAGEVVLGDLGGAVAGTFDGNNAGNETMIGNLLLKVAKLQVAAATGMRARALNPTYFDGFDTIITTGVDALKQMLITPWTPLAIVILGLVLLTKSGRGRTSAVTQRIAVGGVGLILIAFLGQYPLQLSKWLDQKIVGMQTGFDRQFFDRLPASMTPVLRHCNYDLSQFEKAPVWVFGALQISGTACTEQYRPTLNPDDDWTQVDGDTVRRKYYPEYFDYYYYPELMVNQLIYRYWEQGLIGTEDLSGANYDTSQLFHSGQSLTSFEITAAEWQKAAVEHPPDGAIYCTTLQGKRICEAAKGGRPPGRVMSTTEANYRSAVTTAALAGQYEYVQGKAGNRVSAGATALVAATAAAPSQIAAYSGVFAGRVLLRIFEFLGLISALGLLLGNLKVLRRITNTIGSSLVTVLILSAMGSVMTFLTLQVIGNPAVQHATGEAGGLVLLAVISILMWLIVKPVRRIGQMLSTAATGSPSTLSELRHKTTGLFTRRFRNRQLARSIGKRLDGGRRGDNDIRQDGVDDNGSNRDDLADDVSHRRPESRSAMDAATQVSHRYRYHYPRTATSTATSVGDPVVPRRAEITCPAKTNTGVAEQVSRRYESQSPRRAETTPSGVYVITTKDVFRPSSPVIRRDQVRPSVTASSRERNRHLVWSPRRALPPATDKSLPGNPPARPEGGVIVVEGGK